MHICNMFSAALLFIVSFMCPCLRNILDEALDVLQVNVNFIKHQ
jgi:hypothetical protein